MEVKKKKNSKVKPVLEIEDLNKLNLRFKCSLLLHHVDWNLNLYSY
jgi:hypothetical protein